jgi:hypothetical protein
MLCLVFITGFVIKCFLLLKFSMDLVNDQTCVKFCFGAGKISAETSCVKPTVSMCFCQVIDTLRFVQTFVEFRWMTRGQADFSFKIQKFGFPGEELSESLDWLSEKFQEWLEFIHW